MLDIRQESLKKKDLQPLFTDPNSLGFGRIFTDRMFTMKWTSEKGWHEAAIGKLRDLSLHPGAIVLHYGQEIFEGLKAFPWKDGSVRLFRPDRNIQRFNNSAKRLCMPELPPEDMMQSIAELVMTERRWIPRHRGASLYVRPTMIGTEVGLGVRASAEYLYFILLSPVGPYYKEGFKCIDLYVSDEYVRAVPGGMGEAKCGGNYAASLLAGTMAKQKGFAQVLWLDGVHRKYLEEVGAMNMFLVYDRTLVTPRLNGSILPGVTRSCIIDLAKERGWQVEEQAIEIEEVCNDIRRGTLTEIFGSGTAASVSPVGALSYRGKLYVVSDRAVGPVTRELYDRLQGIQYGEVEDAFGWTRKIGMLED